jgi:hypothetical protein
MVAHRERCAVSPEEKPPARVTWRTIEKVADKAERDRLEALSEDEIDRELGAAGIEPGDAAEIVKRAVERDRKKRADARPTTGSKAGLRRPMRSAIGWVIAAAAIAAGVAVAVALKGRSEGDDAAGGDRTILERRAVQLRADAYSACEEKRWAQCESNLDQARGIDHAGEADPRVKEARKAIAQARGEGGER